ncbi:MAG TPA: hypothetical protein VFY30_10950 [Solirubrobacterales bacterium]|nr:hypothetical protein [Solirubrobacterales bacterium]
MLRRRGRALLLPATLLAVLVMAGCGRNDFNNDPRPPIPAEVSVKIATNGVGISPKEFGAGLVNFTIANLTNETGSLTIHGPVTANSDQIAPDDTGTIKVNMKTGSYEASVDGFAVRPFSFIVGLERPSGKNDLQLP